MTVLISSVYGQHVPPSQKDSAPTDKEIIKLFRAHRGNFEKLRKMTYNDIKKASFFSESKIPAGLPELRRNEYRNLLKVSPGLEIGVNYDGTVRFIISSVGHATSPGWAKGIQFIPDRAKIIGTRITSLDEVSNLPSGVYLREIAPRWFLFFQRDD